MGLGFKFSREVVNIPNRDSVGLMFPYSLPTSSKSGFCGASRVLGCEAFQGRLQEGA